MSSIEWTDKTWNPIAGCSRVGPGCDNCYAITMAHRQMAMGRKKYSGVTHRSGGRIDWTGKFSFDPAVLDVPRRVSEKTTWFVNSMSDLFGEGVQDDWLVKIFEVMNQTPQHDYQVLTKRPNRMLSKTTELGLVWSPNIWAGTSIESDKYVGRARLLAKVPAALRFISAEPLLSDLPSLDLTGIGWVIVGGESGVSKAVRPMDPQWVRNIRDRCIAAGVPFFFKQWGAFGADGLRVRSKKDSGHLLDGVEYFQMPASVQAAVAAKAAPAKAKPTMTTNATRIGYRSMILTQLATGPMQAADLRAANGATAKPNSNLHAWALVDLQRDGRITKRLDGRYGLKFRVRAVR